MAKTVVKNVSNKSVGIRFTLKSEATVNKLSQGCRWCSQTSVLDTSSLLSPAVRDVHSLVIRSVRHAHGGVYKSVISNKVGKATCYAHLYVTGDWLLVFSISCFYFRLAVEIFFPLTVLLKRTVAFTEWLEDEMKCLHRWPLQSACWAPNSASFVCELASLAHKDEQMTPYKAVLVTHSGMCVNIDL